MNISVKYNNKEYKVDLSKGKNISRKLTIDQIGPNCFYIPPLELKPLKSGDFTGSIQKGSSVNVYTMKITPHGNGTHTECVGHIDKEFQKINNTLKKFHFIARLIDIYPTKTETGDRVISRNSLEAIITPDQTPEALIIRTLPNSEEKIFRNYSGTNPPYITSGAMQYIVECGVNHILLDLPSVDKEEDGGKLESHKKFWHSIGTNRTESTITELIYVDDHIKEGLYFINMQILNLDLDASPSQVILYDLE